MQRSVASKHSQEKNPNASVARQLKPQRTATSLRTGVSSTHTSSGHHKIPEKPSKPRVDTNYFLAYAYFTNLNTHIT